MLEFFVIVLSLISVICVVFGVIVWTFSMMIGTKAREEAEVKALEDLPQERHYKSIEPK
jgi:nitrate reductase NapE component